MIAGILPTILYCNDLSIQDTIPPVFTTLPAESSAQCDDPNLADLFETWYSRHGGAVADNGEATVFPDISFTVALDSINLISQETCDTINFFEVGFFAIDSCGNQSEGTINAKFFIIDDIKPSIIQSGMDYEMVCDTNTVDSLIAWIDRQAGAIAQDNCSTTKWTNYIWTDNLGNQGFVNIGDSTNIKVQRIDCIWSVNVSFFVEDACGNNNVTTAKFSISGDDESPIANTIPGDSTFQCRSPLPTKRASFTDNCVTDPMVTFIDSTTQSIDEDDCGYYNYTIFRRWLAEDICGNTTEETTIYTIIDTFSPTINFMSSLALDCDASTTDTFNLINITDQCSGIKVSYSDSTTFNSTCQSQFIRKWIVQDACGNLDSALQTFQVQDFTGPQFITPPTDLSISCGTVSIKTEFEHWLRRQILDNIEDNCNSYKVKAVPFGSYTDTTQIDSLPTVEYLDYDCAAPDSLGRLSSLPVSFITYDLCGNITQTAANFAVIDTVPPNISVCPSDFDLQLNAAQCEADYYIILPAFSDNCLQQDEANWEILIDNISISAPPQGIGINLEIGPHEIIYSLKDCGQNESTCTQNISVFDNAPPEIICPASTILYVDPNDCFASFTPPILDSYNDNCYGEKTYENTLPSEEGLLTFAFNGVEEIYQLSDFIINFKNVDIKNQLFKPYLLLEYKFDLDLTSIVYLRDELGNILYSIDESSCNDETIILDLDKNDFIRFSSDSEVKFTIINQVNAGQGTMPCSPNNISGTQGQDEISYIRLSLSYSEILPVINIEEIATGTKQTIEDSIHLEPGIYNTQYIVADAVGNDTDCFSNVEVRDTTPPEIECLDFTYNVSPLLEDFYPILESQINFLTSDNCGIDEITYSPRQLFCQVLNTDVTYRVSSEDITGNKATCNGTVAVLPEGLSPSFISGLCLADTLKLISNLPTTNNLNFMWSGPDGFSSTLSDPIITGINDDASGEYILEVMSPAGCTFTGNLTIDVKQFDSPEIFSNLTTLCNGEELLLNTSSFNEKVEYFWYEGISPNGTLIARTDGPSLETNPTTGTHFYYVEVNGDNCNSNASNTLEISVTPPPTAQISVPFITICEGEDIVLSTDVFQPSYEYEWRGPDNYFSEGQAPDIIENASKSNQGTFTLIIKNGECISDTATAQVIVFEKPDTPLITGESIFCEGQSAVLTVPNIPNGTSYQWFNNGIFYNTVNSNSLLIPSIEANQSGEWSVIAEEGLCVSDTSAAFIVDVKSSLNIGATNNGPLCEGDSVRLTCSFIPDATYQWQDPSGSTYDERNPIALAEEGLYTVTVTTLSNCQAVTSTNVNVGIRPDITALSNTSLPCMTGLTPVTLVSTVFPMGNYEYNWEGPNGFSSSEEEPTINNVNESDNGTYTLTVIQNNCESEPSTTLLNIIEVPDPPVIASNTDPCEGDDIEITIENTSTSNNLTWTWSTPIGEVTTLVPSLSINNFNGDNSGIYAVIQKKGECASDISNQLNINIQSEPIMPIIQGESAYCIGEDIILSSSVPNADSYVWFTPNGTRTLTENAFTINDAGFDDAGSYSLFLQEGNCISETSANFQITINEKPIAPLFEERLVEICSEELNEFEICIQNSVIKDQLQLIEISTGTTLQESTGECFDLSFLLNSSTQVYELAAVAELNGCLSDIIDTVTINIYNYLSETATILEDTITLCNQDFATITAENSNNNIAILWTSEDPEINIFDSDNATASFSNLSPGENKIYLNSSYGVCRNFSTDTIIINILDNIEAFDDSADIKYNESTTILPLMNDNFEQEVNIDVVIEPQHGSLTLQKSSIIYSPNIGYVGDDLATYTICYDACPTLCDDATLNLNIGGTVDCFVGTLITPNGDGYNDKLTVPCLESGLFETNEITIINQWGDEVFSASPYLNDWEGQYNGKLLPVGTYFYILDLGNGIQPIQGYIIIEL